MKFTSLLLLLVLCAGLVQCGRKSESSIYCLPNHFVGDALLIFDQPIGAPVEYRGRARLYRIPANGVLQTQFKPDYGLHIPDRFYYVDARGEFIKELPYFNKASERAGVYQDSDTICLHAVPFKDAATQNTHCLSFIVGPIENSEALHEARENTLRRLR